MARFPDGAQRRGYNMRGQCPPLNDIASPRTLLKLGWGTNSLNIFLASLRRGFYKHRSSNAH